MCYVHPSNPQRFSCGDPKVGFEICDLYSFEMTGGPHPASKVGDP